MAIEEVKRAPVPVAKPEAPKRAPEERPKEEEPKVEAKSNDDGERRKLAEA